MPSSSDDQWERVYNIVSWAMLAGMACGLAVICYLGWQQFQANQAALAKNRAAANGAVHDLADSPGAPDPSMETS